MSRLCAAGKDGHLVCKMGGIANVAYMSFVELTSVSEDGVSLPKIYHAGGNAISLMGNVSADIDSGHSAPERGQIACGDNQWRAR